MGKSATVLGCVLAMQPFEVWERHFRDLWRSMEDGKLKPCGDARVFQGLDSVADAVDWQQSGKNQGKVLVELG
ncbi:hypothetical protein [Streptomyces spiralis]|uniref:hypothetical protein n=1 Tax=Streptomyces spiralis TaxID=66376 RepID=UPI0033FC40D3